jgi:hypothetical protein
MGAAGPSYQAGGTANTQISGTIWVIFRPISSTGSFPHQASSYNLEIYNTAGFPNIGVDTPIATFSMSNSLPFADLSVFAHTTNGQASALEHGTFGRNLNPAMTSAPISPMIETQYSGQDTYPVAVVYLGTDDFREIDE